MSKGRFHKFFHDFFSWQHVAIWVVLIILAGVGVVLAVGYPNMGYRLNHFGNTGDYYTSLTTPQGYAVGGGGGPCMDVYNYTGSTQQPPAKDFFIPTKTKTEILAFAQHAPSRVTVNSCVCPAGQYSQPYQCLDCGAVNLYCPGNQSAYVVSAGYYTTGGTVTTRTGQSICPLNYYCPGDGNQYSCGSGKYTNSTGATAYSQCLPNGGTCVPSPACPPAAECGTDSCGNACGSFCPAPDFCNSHNLCQPKCSIDPLNPC